MSSSSRKSRWCASWFPVVVATACVVGDPGWLYTPPGATPVQDNGRRYDVTGPAGLQLRVYADAFTGSLDAEVDAVGSTQPLADNTHLMLTVEDSSGRPLPPHRAIPPVSTCRVGGRAGSGFATSAVVCSAQATFAIRPLSGCSRNPQLDRVSLVISGFGDGFPSAVKVPLIAN